MKTCISPIFRSYDRLHILVYLPCTDLRVCTLCPCVLSCVLSRVLCGHSKLHLPRKLPALNEGESLVSSMLQLGPRGTRFVGYGPKPSTPTSPRRSPPLCTLLLRVTWPRPTHAEDIILPIPFCSEQC